GSILSLPFPALPPHAHSVPRAGNRRDGWHSAPLPRHGQKEYAQDHGQGRSPPPDPHSASALWQPCAPSGRLPAYGSVWSGNDLPGETETPASCLSGAGTPLSGGSCLCPADKRYG